MRRLFQFLYQYRAFLFFFFLELICLWLIVNNNPYQGAKFFNSSNRYAALFLNSSNSISEYFGLKSVNQKLAEENAELKKNVSRLNLKLFRLSADNAQSELFNQFEFIAAKVIKNSVRQSQNYITINKGSDDGIEYGMAVVDNEGIVGKVKSVSKHFALVTSILHTEVLVSAKVLRTGDLCTVEWPGESPYEAMVTYLPKHVNIQEGDSVVTSGYNAVFPEGMPIAVIKEFGLKDDSPFYDIKAELTGDLNRLSYVYLVKNNFKAELDSVQVEETEVRQ
ncbi:MAG: rod shape-determining protein MreC [Bacteroidota bacterium]